LIKNNELIDFCELLESICIKTVESGKMTKDLAILIHNENLTEENYLTTEKFLNELKINLDKKTYII
jgi:isocitrate dehydrogenase